ncbi:MAG: ribosome small subunit-dependent GTPase A [Planctomycetales bacterium 12-60-4]|nr:MAG: ribosome small subunit-dependent GTPase A [Planctomycetales bacterium 12-60-4]
MSSEKPRKIRVDLRKNRAPTARQNDLTRAVGGDDPQLDSLAAGERISGKGNRTRRRTVIGEVDADGRLIRNVDLSTCRPGRVIRAVGATQCFVLDESTHTTFECTVRRMLRTMSSDERTAVVTGDRVLFEPADEAHGVIERVEPRRGVLTRGHQYREHVLVANVSLVAIVVSVAQPHLKPALIDRFLISAAKGGVNAAICLSKCDLVDLVDLQPIIGLYSRLGYPTIPMSTRTGFGLERLRQQLLNQQTVFTGQSGVGKSSLLNALNPEWKLRTGEVSEWTQKGKHTTRYAQLLELTDNSWVVDTPGIRQLDLWGVAKGEIEGYFREFRPFVSQCKFPNCLHLEEQGCAVRQAVQTGLITRLRYESYTRLVVGDA